MPALTLVPKRLEIERVLTILIGLPGSGKSTFGREQRQKLPGLIIYEDFLGACKPLDDDRGLFSLLCNVRDGKNIVADDVFLCRLDYRTTFETLMRPFVSQNYEVRWVYYTNSPDECRSNVELRFRQTRIENDRDRERAEARRRHSLSWIDGLKDKYNIPDDAEPVPVFRHPT